MKGKTDEGSTTDIGSAPTQGTPSAGYSAARPAAGRERHGQQAGRVCGPETPPVERTAAFGQTSSAATPDCTSTTKQHRQNKKGGVKSLKAHSLIDKVYRWENLELAYRRVKRNKGTHGLDRVTLRMFEADKDKHLREIQRKLRERRYTWQPVRRVYIPKSSNPKESRPLGIPVVADRIVGQALIQVLDPIFDPQLSDRSFAYRRGRKAHDAIATILDDLKEGYTFVVDADIKACFDEICHLVAMSRVKERVADGRVLDLLEAYLKAGVFEAGKVFVPKRGIPQGGVVSPMLMNLVLDGLDRAIESHGFRLVRYADDFVILCRSQQEAHDARALAQETLKHLQLRLHPDKTRVVSAWKGFVFLGFHFRRGFLSISEKAIDRFKDKVRHLTRRQQGTNIETVIAALNPRIRGWASYFGVANASRPLRHLDAWIRMRLRGFKFKRRNHNDNWRLPNKKLERWGYLSLQTCRPAVRLCARRC